MMNEFCKGGGCTAKLGPGILDKVLKMIPKKADPNLLVGFDHSDDAAVYQLTDELAVVQTLISFRRWWKILISLGKSQPPTH